MFLMKKNEVKKMKHNKYEIRKIEDMLKIPFNRQDQFLKDLKIWLIKTKLMQEDIKKIGGELSVPNLVWIDDNKQDLIVKKVIIQQKK